MTGGSDGRRVIKTTPCGMIGERQLAHIFQQTVQTCLELRASELHEAAEPLPRGEERDGLLQRARKMKAASQVIDRWLASPGLRAPR